MGTHEGNSVPVVKEFQIQGTWAPVTPIKPALSQPRPIYGGGQGGLLAEAILNEQEEYLSRFSQNNHAQTLVSCSVTSAENSIPNNSNNVWHDNLRSPFLGRVNLERENVELQRRGLEDYLPHWSSQGRRSPTLHLGSTTPVSSTYPSFSSWDFPLPWANNGVRENVNTAEQNSSDPLFNNTLTFGDLLAMNGSSLGASAGMGMANNCQAATTAFFPGCDSQPQGPRFVGGGYMFGNDDSPSSLNHLNNDINRQEMASGVFPNHHWSISNINSPPSAKHINGRLSALAPPTPDLRPLSGKINLELNQRPEEEVEVHEHEAAAAMVDLRDLNHKEVAVPEVESTSGKVSMAVEENHNPDKGSDQNIDLNKTPQKKPRRRRYQPKVVREDKPKRTPKPKTPKATESTETPRVKRKFVRKNKTTTPSVASPAGATETITSKPEETTPKSCKKSLNFDLNGQDMEHNSLYMSNGGSCTEPQQEGCHTAGNRSSHVVHLSQGEHLVVGTSQFGIAYDLNCAVSQELKNYISQPAKDNQDSLHHDQTVIPGEKETNIGSESGNNAQAFSRKDPCRMQSPNSSPCASSNEGVKIRGSKRGHSITTDSAKINAGNTAASHSAFWQPGHTVLGNASVHGFPGVLFPEIHKKKRTDKGQRSHTSSTSSSATASEGISQAAGTQNLPGIYPAIPSKYYYFNPAPFGNAVANNQAEILARNAQNMEELSNTWADMARLKKKKRSKGTTRVRDLASLKGIASVSKPSEKRPRGRKAGASNKPCPSTLSNINTPDGINSGIEAIIEGSHATPRSKGRPRKQNSSRRSNVDKTTTPHRDLVLYDANQFIRKTAGSVPALPWISNNSLGTIIEAITEGMRLLDINREGYKITYDKQSALVPYNFNSQEQNAIVPYGKDGTIVPFEGPFDPVRKRRQRAKVDLDDETTRVWRLLLENINSEGIDGTDEEKAKWWENERCVFRGRVDSFIARMRLVQGDRRFTPWKGSVLDSVIGVFLTQNVSDHLSSSAFMALAARFPLKSESIDSTLSEEATSTLVAEPEICIIEPEESITWHEKPADKPIFDRNSGMIHVIDPSDEKEAVSSKELTGSAHGLASPIDYSCESSRKVPIESRENKADNQATRVDEAGIRGDDRARDDATSSQQSVISSQNSISSPVFQSPGIMSTFPESNSRAQTPATNLPCNYSDCSTSFMGLLRLAESPLLRESYGQITGQESLQFVKSIATDSPEAPDTSPRKYQLHLKADFQVRASKYIEMLESESRCQDTSRKDENSTMESNLTTEPTVQHLAKEKSVDGTPKPFAESLCSCYVLEGEEMVIQSQTMSTKHSPDNVASPQGQSDCNWKSPHLPNSSQETADVTESTTNLVRISNEQKFEQVSEHDHASGGGSEIANPSPTKPKKTRTTKDKRYAYDWDSLRKESQANGRRERTANTRDSIDWEAVRHADVSEIAETIKERGMNNMLAERIKDLLDRLVKDHGSIDLEWLRDIPPDKAKEYLLSFRGLGLKSVECVRLLTLHHLAFPVDTNVGRIAVRLGWVPLQPLPESLQLHLLEMYPILESIQKYLWPRLCKLDQKTLYELHYHMITFGKVFCTKRQPNCNACPLRGECRHFASAFASARLALPGPEEKSIVASNGDNSTHISPQASINPLPLPPAWGNHHHEMSPRCNMGVTVLANSSGSQSLSLPYTVHPLQRNSQANCEPIVEVPASPEPDPEPEQTLCDIEDELYEDPDEIPVIKLNMKQFSQTLQNYMQAKGELQEHEMSQALVALTPEAASLPTPKLKNISRLRTEHHVFELPDTHPLLRELDRREPDDPCSYLLAIWTPGETPNSIEPPERRCSSADPTMLCQDETCSYCNSQREVNSQIVRGTLLIPCRTAMRGSFPLNGTYFQVNEVFADHDSSLNPIQVPRSWLWNLQRRTVYFGTSIPTIFRGLTTEEIQHCFWRGYVCVRGFDQRVRAPRPLMARLHFPASKMTRGAKGKPNDE